MNNKTPNKVSAALKRVQQFLEQDMWDLEMSSLSSLPRYGVGLLRIGYLVIRRFHRDKLPVHASALTLSTLIAIVPLMAISLSMAKGLGAGDRLIDKLNAQVEQLDEKLREAEDVDLLSGETLQPVPTPDQPGDEPQKQQITDLINNIISQVEEADFFAIGGIGGLILLVMVIQMLNSIEDSFNTVWGITTHRNLLRKSANYISTLVVVPVLILASGAITAAFIPMVERWGLGFAYKGLLRFSPYLATWLAFTFLYVFLPNTRVRAKPALVSGFIAALLWVGWFRFYISFQPGVGRTNVIYGTLAAVPIFLAWLYMSWVIVLLGAEIAFAVQNHSTFKMEQGHYRASPKSRLMLALAVVVRAARALEEGAPPFETTRFALEEKVSIRFLNEIIGILVRAGLLTETVGDREEYVMLKAPEHIQVKDLIDIIQQEGASPEDLGIDRLDEKVAGVMRTAEDGLATNLEGVTIKSLLQAAS